MTASAGVDIETTAADKVRAAKPATIDVIMDLRMT
jgi:hypothetical protein